MGEEPVVRVASGHCIARGLLDSMLRRTGVVRVGPIAVEPERDRVGCPGDDNPVSCEFQNPRMRSNQKGSEADDQRFPRDFGRECQTVETARCTPDAADASGAHPLRAPA